MKDYKKPVKIQRLGASRPHDLPETFGESLFDKFMPLIEEAEKNEPLFAGDSFSRNQLFCCSSINDEKIQPIISFGDMFSAEKDEKTLISSSNTGKLNFTGQDNNKITINDETCIYTSDSIYIGDPPGTYQIGDNIDNTPMYSPNYPYSIGGTSTFKFGLGNDKYAVMNLPRKELPLAVYICGRMLTLGILGTDVECAYTGKQIVFEPGVVSSAKFGNRITVSVEYKDEIFHYNIGRNGNIAYENEKSSTLEVTLVSTIRKDGALSGSQ